MQEPRPIPRRSASELSPNAFVKEYLHPGRPVVLTGLADAWRATTLWSLEYLLSKFRDVAVVGMAWDGDAVEDFFAYSWIKATLGSWAEERLAPHRPRTHGFVAFQVSDFGPELAGDVGSLDEYMGLGRVPAKLARKLVRTPQLWLNQAGSTSPLHFGGSHDFLAQIHGSKRLVLFGPRDSKNLHYPCEELERYGPEAATFALVDPEAPDLERFPRFGRAVPWVCTVVAGEILFVPARTWQFTRFPDTSISVSYFWTTPGALLRGAGTAVSALRRKLVARFEAG